MATVSLPLAPSIANSRVGTTLSGKVYLFDVRWNTREEAWYMDILAEDETILLSGIRIVLGSLLGGQSVNHDLPPGFFITQDLAGTGQEATFDDLGVRVQVWYIPFEDFGTVTAGE